MPVHAADQTKFTDQEVVKYLCAKKATRPLSYLEKGAIRVKVDGMTYVLFNREDGDLQAFFGVSETQASLSNDEYMEPRHASYRVPIWIVIKILCSKQICWPTVGSVSKKYHGVFSDFYIIQQKICGAPTTA
jgi:hypothetical protein